MNNANIILLQGIEVAKIYLLDNIVNRHYTIKSYTTIIKRQYKILFNYFKNYKMLLMGNYTTTTIDRIRLE